MYRLRCILAHLLFKMAEKVQPKDYPQKLQSRVAQQKNLRATRMARLKGPK